MNCVKFSFVCLPSTDCGSSIIRMGLVLARMSMGRRERNSSSSMLMRLASLPLALKAWELMIMVQMELSDAKRSIIVSCDEL